MKAKIREVIDVYSRIKGGFIPTSEREELVDEIYYAITEGKYDENGTIPFRRHESSESAEDD